jgi:hypothetical protein
MQCGRFVRRKRIAGEEVGAVSHLENPFVKFVTTEIRTVREGSKGLYDVEEYTGNRPRRSVGRQLQICWMWSQFGWGPGWHFLSPVTGVTKGER